MITYYLHEDQVRAYARDLARRLDSLGDELPNVWFPLGESGEAYAELLLAELPSNRCAQIVLCPFSLDSKSGAIAFTAEAQPPPLDQRQALVIDSSVHSGKSLLAAIEAVAALGACSVCSCTLVVKQSTCLVPTWFGVVIGEHDRAYFLLKEIPNNRLFRAGKPPFGTLRRLRQGDVSLPGLVSGLESLDNQSWGDYLYDSKENGCEVFVFERQDAIIGFVSFKTKSNRMLFVDSIAVDKARHGQGIGGLLLRWCETLARARSCHGIELWAIDSQLEFYRSARFVEESEAVLDLGKERYHKMRRPLLYNLPFPPSTDAGY